MTPADRELLHRHLNGDLRGAEQAAFFARLRASPELRRELASYATDEALLSEAILEERHVARLPGRRPESRRPGRATVAPLAAAACFLVGLAVLFFPASAPPAGRLVSAEPGTTVRRNGELVPVKPGLELYEEDVLTGSGALALPGGALDLRSGSVRLIEGGRRLELRGGSIRGTLPARVDAGAGTVFAADRSVLDVSFQSGRLRASVDVGSARVESKGQAAVLPAGTYALVTSGIETGRAVPGGELRQAVGRAQAFLVSRKADLTRPLRDGKRHAEAPPRTYAELAALALPEGDPLQAELVAAMLAKPIESTYTAALQAVALARLDPVRHQDRLRLCYRFLADSQGLNGQWDYGEAPPRRPPSGDNSCSAYAALGLRACREAGIEVDRETVLGARAWWLRSQNPDGGWGYQEFGRLEPETNPRPDYATNASYGSTTASGVSSLLVLSGLLGEDYTSHASVRRGLEWLARNHATDRNPRKTPGFSHLHYWLALERLGLTLGTERVGAHEWFADGAEFLLPRQRADGSWKIEEGDFMGREIGDVLDTCLAVLFLRRVPFSREEP
jgi:ferric-dicitrate binding protein FerR (iron transport regulator)